MRSPEVSIRIAFCSSVSLCGTNQEQIFHLSKSSRTMVCAVSLLMHNSSAINLSVSRRSWASIYHTFWIISGVLFVVDGRPELDSSSVVPSLRESIWTISKPIFCSRLPSRTHAPTFHASPLQFSPICSRIWCLHVAHRAVTHLSHWLRLTGRSWFTLPVTCSPCCVSILPMSLKNHHMRAHMRQVAVQMTPFTELFRHTLWCWDQWIRQPALRYILRQCIQRS